MTLIKNAFVRFIKLSVDCRFKRRTIDVRRAGRFRTLGATGFESLEERALLSISSGLDMASVARAPLINDAWSVPDLTMNEIHPSAFLSPPPVGEAAFGAQAYDGSEFMQGDVWVTLVLLESDGTTDPNTENWTAAEITNVKNEIQEGLTWWEDTLAAEFTTAMHDLTFHIDFTHADTPVSTPYEPITRETSDENLWIDSFLDSVGANTGSSHLVDMIVWNDNQRVDNNSHWGVTIFVVDSSADPDGEFLNGGFAYSYLGGPLIMMTYDNSNWGIGNMGQVTAHELAHSFYALDEYPSDNNVDEYLEFSGYYNTQNLNAADGHPAPGTRVDSITAEATLQNSAYDNHTSSPSLLAMIGWQDTDANGIIDLLDVPLTLTGSGTYNSSTSEYEFSGTSSVATLNNQNPQPSSLANDITTNTVDRIQYSLDGGAWTDGSAYSAYTTPVAVNVPAGPGVHTVEIRTLFEETQLASNIFSDTFGSAALVIDVGDHLLLPAEAGQVVDVVVVGGDQVAGLNCNVQVADAGPEAGGSIDGPEIDLLRIFDDSGPRNFVFDNVNTGTTDLDGDSPDAAPQWEGRSTTTPSGTVSADGLLAEITLSTINGAGADFTSGTWDLFLSDTLNGSTDFPGSPVQITDGSITISTKPIAKPVTDAIAQYSVVEGGTLVLDASESTDPEESFMFGTRLLELDSIVEYRWDLDGDGLFGETGAGATNGDELGVNPTFSAANLDGADDSPWLIRLEVVDTTGLVSDVVSTDVLITNLPPSIDTFTITGPINEGETATLSGTYSDPADADTHELDIDWNGDGTYDQTVTVSGGTFSVNHLYPDDDPTGTPSDTFNVQMQLRDDDNGVDTASVSMTVHNLAPTASITGDVAGGPEGTAIHLDATVSDPGVTETFTYLWQVTASNGQVVANGTNATYSFTPNDNGTYTVSLTVTDDDTGETSDTADITIGNVAPSVDTLSVISPINENQTATLSGTYSDPGSADTHTLQIDWDGDGTYDQTASVANGSFSLDHIYLDDNPTLTPSDTFNLGVRLADDDSAAVTETASITVVNVSPTVTVSGPPSGAEGTAISLTSNVSDPGTLDTFTYLWQVTATNGQVISDGTASTFAFTPNDNGDYTVTLLVTDDDTGTGSDEITVSVSNVSPVLGAVSVIDPVDENATTTLTGTYQDAGTADTHVLDIDWNDDGTYDQTITVTGGTFSVNHQYLDDDPTNTASDTFPIGVKLRDDDTGADTSSASLTVNNVVPQFVVGQIDQAIHIDNDQPLILDWEFNDPGSLDTFTATIDWGDGTIEPASTITPPSGGQPGTVQAGHTYATIGSYPVSLTLSDDDLGEAVDVFTLDVVQGVVHARHVFYNNSAHDGDTPGADAADDNAIDASKQVLLPGETATFANYTSYSRGINGLMIDITGLGGTPSASDFIFKVGNENSPANWVDAPAPQSITVRPGAGANGSDRITLIWADNDWSTSAPEPGSIAKQWLEVSVLATSTTGLGQNDVFYIGNAVGDTGNSSTDTIVNATDEINARNNPHYFLDPALVDDIYDFNHDERVNATDEIIARSNQTYFLTDLELITPPISTARSLFEPLAKPSAKPITESPQWIPSEAPKRTARSPGAASIFHRVSVGEASSHRPIFRDAATWWYSQIETSSQEQQGSLIAPPTPSKAFDEILKKFW